MKKLVLVVICALVMTLFIAFNYVLWDRENKIKDFADIEITKNASINALARQNNLLDESNKQLKSSVDDLKAMVSQQQASSDQLKQENLKTIQTLMQKNELINKLLQQTDLKPIEAVLRKWAESIEKGQYEEAYKLMRSETMNNGKALSLNEFTASYKGSVKLFKVKAVKLAAGKTGSDNKAGDLFLNVTLEVKKAENADKAVYVDGNNERVFGIAYDKSKDSWLIASIAAE